MKEISAKLEFNDVESAENLIRAFFENFNSGSGIEIKGKSVKLVIVFNESEPPIKIINAITNCEVSELIYNKPVLNKLEQAEMNSESENSKQAEQAEMNSECRDTHTLNLEHLAKEAYNFENFAELISECYEMGKRKELFKNVIIAATEVKKVTWKEITEFLSTQKNMAFSENDRIYFGKKISYKSNSNDVTIIAFIRMASKYKNYQFNNSNNVAFEETNSHEEDDKVVDEVDVVLKQIVKMDCMPEIDEFEKVLSSINNCQSINHKIYKVLAAMGINDIPVNDQKLILKIANIAVNKKEMNLDVILSEAEIPENEVVTARMIFSKFVNDYVRQYDAEKQVKLLEFLCDLQKVVFFEEDERSLFNENS